MNSSIYQKLLGAHLLLIAGLAFAFILVAFHLVNSQYEQVLGNQLEATASALHPIFEPYMLSKEHTALDSLVKDMSERSGYRLTCILPGGRVVADSESNPANMVNHSDRPEIIAAFAGEPGRSLRYSATLHSDMLYVAIPLRNGDDITGVLRLSMFSQQVSQLRNLLKNRLLLVLFPLVMLAAILALVLANNLSRPIREIARAAERVADGHLDVQLRLQRSDELHTLSESFNTMVVSLRNLLTQQKQQTDTLNAIIASLNEGLCVIDEHERVIHASDSFRRMFAWRDIRRKNFWEIIRDANANEFVKNLRASGGSDKRPLEIGDKVLLCSGSMLPDTGHVVLLFYDLTALVQADRQKKEFVSNVSHELKTPLTSIKGFLETLQDVVEDDEARHYIDIIDRNANRLIHIVKDLLLLSTLDADKSGEMAPTDLGEVIENVCVLYRKRIHEKGLDLDILVPDDLPLVEADDYQLEQVVTNLLQNAIQYTEDGGVTISCVREGDYVKLVVSDTGVGIPQHHLPHLFERFYVVDKSRSKKYGGTGLGLSIVKQVIHRHHGDIDVETRVGGGATFYVRLPLKQPAGDV